LSVALSCNPVNVTLSPTLFSQDSLRRQQKLLDSKDQLVEDSKQVYQNVSRIVTRYLVF